MEGKKPTNAVADRQPAVPGIVIRGGFEPVRRPKVSAFIWGGKVRPVPAIPYGRRSA
jgi:hypothetical protein